MRRKRSKPNYRKIVLRLPDLDHAKASVLNSLSSPQSRRNYCFAMDQFIAWYCSEPRLALNRTVVLRFRLYLESLGLAAGIRRVKGVKHLGQRSGKWLNIDQAELLVDKSDGDGLRNKRDFAMISILLGCGLRRAELAASNIDDIQIRQGHWVIVDLVGKGGHVRTVPMPAWVKDSVDQWLVAADLKHGRIFRAVSRHGSCWGRGISENVVWYVVRECAKRMGLEHIAPHDLRRTCAKLCYSNGWRT
jgi:integrase